MNTTTLSAEQHAEREERFRYVDLQHPLLQVLFHLQLPTQTD